MATSTKTTTTRRPHAAACDCKACRARSAPEGELARPRRRRPRSRLRTDRRYVVWLQRALNRLVGPRLPAPLAVDGKLGPKTRAAVRRFQQLAGLRVDGLAGPRTERALRSYGAPPPPPAPMIRQGIDVRRASRYNRRLRRTPRRLQAARRLMQLPPSVSPASLRFALAVARFQQRFASTGLKRDGMLGRKTWAVMRRLLRRPRSTKPPPRPRPRRGCGKLALRYGFDVCRASRVNRSRMARLLPSQRRAVYRALGPRGRAPSASIRFALAVLRFQRRYRGRRRRRFRLPLRANGRLDGRTLRALIRRGRIRHRPRYSR